MTSQQVPVAPWLRVSDPDDRLHTWFRSGADPQARGVAHLPVFPTTQNAESADALQKSILPLSACSAPPRATPVDSDSVAFGLRELRVSLATEKNRGLSPFALRADDVRYDAKTRRIDVVVRNFGKQYGATQVRFATPHLGATARVGRHSELALVDTPIVPPGGSAVISYTVPVAVREYVGVTVDPYRATYPWPAAADRHYVRPDIDPRHGDGRSIFVDVVVR